jgi:glycosyltransferase involved in cell wall biosynthesis
MLYKAAPASHNGMIAERSAMPHLVWVFPGPLTDKLDAATWLDTTRELRKMDWRVTMVAAGPAGRQCIQGVEVLCIPNPQVYFLGQLAFHVRLLHLLLQQWATIDVVLFHSMSVAWILPLGLLRRLMGRQQPMLVVDTRTLHMPPGSRESWKDRLRQAFQQLMERAANRWADGRLAITQRMAEAVRIPPEKLWGVWPSGVDPARFYPAQAARRWPLAGEPIHLIYIGALHYERNLMTLSRAVVRANTERMAFILSLVGDGAERMDLGEFASQTGGQVLIVPPVPHDQVWEVLAQAHIGVLPFPDEEKFRVSSPIKLFEYMAAGLPILATRIACHTDVVGRGEYAFWANDADEEGLLEALRLIWQSRDSLGEKGRQAAVAVQAWTWAASARRLRSALENGIARSSSGSGRQS